MPFQKGIVPWNKGIKGVCRSNSTSFKKGSTPWNKGISASKESIKKMRDGLQVWCEEREHYPNWKGGISYGHKIGYSSSLYKEWREKVFKRDNYICQDCGICNGNGKSIYLTAHHIKSFAKHPELKFEISNGITLCENCHCKVDKYRARFMKKEN